MSLAASQLSCEVVEIYSLTEDIALSWPKSESLISDSLFAVPLSYVTALFGSLDLNGKRIRATPFSPFLHSRFSVGDVLT